MFENLNKYKILLASNSPRRKELLFKLGLRFDVITSVEVDESYPDSLKYEQIPSYLAQKKAEAYMDIISDDNLLIAADTVVVCDDKVLGKPHNEAEARRMLMMLSGKTHDVITGVAILTRKAKKVFAVTTKVTFDKLGDDAIDYYISTYHPFDKAGAYGIQEWIGCIGVSEIHGSYFNVMGLPVQRLYRELADF